MLQFLTIDEIGQKLDTGTLPVTYSIKTPTIISCNDLIKVLNKFQNDDLMLAFIVQLSNDKNVSIQSDKKTITLGSLPHFIHAYSSNSLYPKMLDKSKQRFIVNFFKRKKFTKDQLTYLLQNLSDDNVRDIVLEGHCFYTHDLMDICNNINVVSKLPEYTNKLLYHYLNPTRRWDSPTTPYLDMFYFAYRAGHILGLKDTMEVTVSGQKIKLDPEGEFTSVSLKLLMDITRRYQQIYPNRDFETIFEALKFDDALMNINSPNHFKSAEDDILLRYQEDKLVYIASGWTGHTVGIALYGDYLMYCNRGENGDPTSGCRIFKIKDRSLINQDFLQKLANHQKNAKEYEKILSTVIDLKSPVVKLKSKPQKYGNCTFANAKSSVEGMLVLLQAGPFATENEMWLTSQLGRRNYKRFTRFIRDREIDEIIKNMFYARDPSLINFYALLIKKIVTTHHGKPRGSYKDNDEVVRAYELFQRSTATVQAILRTDIDFMKIITNIEPTYNDILNAKKIWRQPGIREEVVYDYRRYAHRISVENGYMTSINGKAIPKMHFSYNQARKMIKVT